MSNYNLSRYEDADYGVVDAIPVENFGEEHLLLIVLLDLSGSMCGFENTMHEAITRLIDGLSYEAKGKVEIAVVGFNNDAFSILSAGPVYGVEVPRFLCGGGTNIDLGFDECLLIAEKRKELYNANGVSYKRPILTVLTDGCPTRNAAESINRLKDAIHGRHITLVPVAVGPHADSDFLNSLGGNRTISIEKAKDSLISYFEWLSASVSETSEADTTVEVVYNGVNVQLPA